MLSRRVCSWLGPPRGLPRASGKLSFCRPAGLYLAGRWRPPLCDPCSCSPGQALPTCITPLALQTRPCHWHRVSAYGGRSGRFPATCTGCHTVDGGPGPGSHSDLDLREPRVHREHPRLRCHGRGGLRRQAAHLHLGSSAAARKRERGTPKHHTSASSSRGRGPASQGGCAMGLVGPREAPGAVPSREEPQPAG